MMAAVVSGMFAVVGSVVTVLLKNYIDNRYKQRMSSGRRTAIAGTWHGTASQEGMPEGEPHTFEFTMTLNAGLKTLSGRLDVRYQVDGKPFHSHFDVTGGFYYDRFLQLEYRPLDGATVQFGSAILELDSRGLLLEGRCVGYGKETATIRSGPIRATKTI